MKTSTLRSCWNTRLSGATAALLALSLLGVACGDADYVEDDENNTSVNNNTNNNNPPADPCAALPIERCEEDPRCDVQSLPAPCAGDAECPAIAELTCVSVGCLSDSDCPAGYGCVYDGTTEPTPAPSPDNCDCGGAEDCLDNCGTPIAPAEVGYCAPRQDEGCQSDADCGPNQACQPGFGVPCYCPPCEDGANCADCECGGAADPAPPGICVDIYVSCWGDDDCGSAQYCDWDTQGEPEPDIAPCDCFCEEGAECDCACGAPAPEPGGICRDRNTWCSWDGDCRPGERCDFNQMGGGSDEDCACEPCAGDDCAPCDCGGAAPAPGGLCVPAPVECGDDEPVFCDAEPPSCPGGVVVGRGGCWACVDPITCEDLPFGSFCDDGTALVCERAEPVCPPNAIAAVQGGCWSCVDPNTCQPTVEPSGCENVQDPITCSDSGCSWLDCPSDRDCDSAGTCTAYIPEERLSHATLTPDCAPNDGPAFRIAAGDGGFACGESPEPGHTLEVYSWSYSAQQLLPGASYSLDSASIRYCGPDGACLEASSGVLYLGDAQNANAISGQLLFHADNQRHLISFEALRCDSLGFCG